MTTWGYRRLKNKLESRDYIKQQLRYWAEKEKSNSTFYSFECSEFFKGKTLAELNKEIYYEKARKIRHKIKQYKELLERVM